ncbi:MAG: ferredoxin--NADP reductase, partial [Rhodobacteraceae bacterium]
MTLVSEKTRPSPTLPDAQIVTSVRHYTDR